MFSGIIEQVGEVINIEDHGDRRLAIKTKFAKNDVKIGEWQYNNEEGVKDTIIIYNE